MSSSVLLSIIITLFLLSICCQSKINNFTFDCIPSEKKALLRFKASFSDDPYILSSWKNDSNDCCSWEGVECDNATRHVVKLDLNNRFASGVPSPLRYGLRNVTIDSSLLELKYLSYLDLSGNSFNDSSIPTFLGSMKQLEYLDMSGVDLGGTKDIIKVLSMLPSLVDLRLSGSGLANTNLPLANCLNRSTLLFPNVQYLDLSSNLFGENSSFCFLHNMTSLSFLDLSFNSLHQKGDWIFDKCHLKSLSLEYNNFYGDMSVAFRNLSGCLGSNLESLNLRDNEFDGHLPEDLGELKQLTKLDVSRNNLSGHIPSSIGNLSALRSLDLSENQLGGDIPVSLGQLSNLEYIYMHDNSLEGTLSEAHFANLSRLEYLDIGYNYKLKFRVGDDWVPPFQLGTLSMIFNIIEGQFPQWLQTQKSLTYLSLRNCSIRGTLPSWLGSLMNLTHLDLSKNHIEGPIIPELPSRGLRLLDLSRNLINGSIPKSLCQMKYLENLDLSKNNITGHLPDCNWGNFDSLILSSNQLSGPIPNSIGGDYCALSWLQLDNNSLTGQLPSTLKNCTRLVALDVGDNKLSGGKLPEWIGNHLLKLSVLRLRNNKFDGDIPSSYCQLSKLQIMNLAQNQLTGYIPQCFGNLSGMINADYGFSGEFSCIFSY